MPKRFPRSMPGGAGNRLRAVSLLATVLLTVFASLVAGGCGAASSEGRVVPGLPTLTLALDYTPNVNYLGIYVAMEKGWFRQAGVNLKILPYTGTPAESLLEAGKADIGLTYPPSIPAARASGLNYQAIAGLTQKNTIGIAVLASSPYRRVGQLSGKVYGGFGVASDKPVLMAVFKAAGVARPSVREVDLGDNAYQALAAHRVAYSIVFGGIDDVTAELSGVKLRIFPIRQYLPSSFTFPDDTFVAETQKIAKRPGPYRDVLAALSRGYNWAAQHPEAAGRILIAANRSALDHSSNIIMATALATAPTFVAPCRQWGQMDQGDFSGLTSILVHGGLIAADKAPPVSSDYTNSLLPGTP